MLNRVVIIFLFVLMQSPASSWAAPGPVTCAELLEDYLLDRQLEGRETRRGFLVDVIDNRQLWDYEWTYLEGRFRLDTDAGPVVASMEWRYLESDPSIVMIGYRRVNKNYKGTGIGVQLTAQALEHTKRRTGVPVQFLISEFGEDNLASYNHAVGGPATEDPDLMRFGAESTAAYRIAVTLGYRHMEVRRHWQKGIRLLMAKEPLPPDPELDRMFSFF